MECDDQVILIRGSWVPRRSSGFQSRIIRATYVRTVRAAVPQTNKRAGYYVLVYALSSKGPCFDHSRCRCFAALCLSAVITTYIKRRRSILLLPRNGRLSQRGEVRRAIISDHVQAEVMLASLLEVVAP
jgi:hypothetical protein